MPTTQDSAASTTDRIEEQVQFPAPRSRVWRALTNPDELGAWFGANLTGATIAPGAQVLGHFTMPGYEHMMFDVTIEDMEVERRFSWRWHPHTPDAGVSYAEEPRTLVTFLLDDTATGGTLLRVVETGFSQLAAARRSSALSGNTKGWAGQLHKRLATYLASAA